MVFLREVVMRCELKHRCLRTFLGISTFPGYSIVLGAGSECLRLDELLKSNTSMGFPHGLVSILRDTASALAYIHDTMGPHCSLSSSVVRVGGLSSKIRAELDGLHSVRSDKLVDFGLEDAPIESNWNDDESASAWYKAPEVLEGGEPTRASDIWYVFVKVFIMCVQRGFSVARE